MAVFKKVEFAYKIRAVDSGFSGSPKGCMYGGRYASPEAVLFILFFYSLFSLLTQVQTCVCANFF